MKPKPLSEEQRHRLDEDFEMFTIISHNIGSQEKNPPERKCCRCERSIVTGIYYARQPVLDVNIYPPTLGKLEHICSDYCLYNYYGMNCDLQQEVHNG
jgi:hypothetical protein